MDDFPHAKKPCDECPWRTDVPTGKFPAERFAALAHTAYDMAMQVFACHKSYEGAEFVCAGFLAVGAKHNLSVRLALARQSCGSVYSPWPLFPSYRAMAEANGVSPEDPALKDCRA